VDAEEKERMSEEWKQDLAKLEDEITTLRSVLSAKVRSAAELKRKLGITPMTEMKKDVKQGIQNIKETEAYKKTNEQLSKLNETITTSTAYQKTNATFKSIGAWSSRKFGDLRNSNTFKSFEEKVGSTYTSVKQSRSYGNLKSKLTKVSGSKSEQSFEDALQSAANEEAAAGGGNQATTPGSLPEEKVPL